jgi:hypothetical protein
MGVGVQSYASVALPPGKRHGTHCIGGYVGPGLVRTDVENLDPTGIRSSVRPTRSETLYRLCYSCPLISIYIINSEMCFG